MKSFFLNLWEDIKNFFGHFRVYLKWLALALVLGGYAGASLLRGLFSLVVESGGCSLVAVRGPLIVVASLVVEHGI